MNTQPETDGGQAARRTTIHGSPQGNDAWSGAHAPPAREGQDGPVATLERARDLARAARQANGPDCYIEVLLHQGVYRRKTPLVLGAEDGGTPEAPTVWRSADQESALVTGLHPLEGTWEPIGDGVWTLGLPPGTTFRQLFCQDRRLARTRWPREGYLQVYAFAGEGEDNHRRQFRFLKGDVQRWQNLDDVEFVVIHNWSEARLFVRELDVAGDTVTFTGAAAYPFDFGGWNAYYIDSTSTSTGPAF